MLQNKTLINENELVIALPAPITQLSPIAIPVQTVTLAPSQKSLRIFFKTNIYLFYL